MSIEEDFRLKVMQVARDVRYRKDGYQLTVNEEDARLYFQVEARRIDTFTNQLGIGYGGKAFPSPNQSVSDLVRQAFGLFASYEEHECREAFTWRGARIFGPHIDVHALASITREVT